MFAMQGLRTFSLAPYWDSGRISCDAQGAFVGAVALLKHAQCDEGAVWTVQPAELNAALTACYRLPIDVSAKAGALTLIANALNRGDLAMAAIATVQMQFPDPPVLAKGGDTAEEFLRRAIELHRSHLLKIYWDPAKHPRAGTPPNPGWFAPVQYRPSPRPFESGGGAGVPRGTLELPFPSLPRFLSPRGVAPEPAGPEMPRSVPQPTVEPQPQLPFEDGLPPKLAPYVPRGKTVGIFQPPNGSAIELESGNEGPAASIPLGTDGFDGVVRLHVEGHAAALMRQKGITNGTLYINNPEICVSCMRLLPKLLPPGARLRVVLPDGTVTEFEGIGP
jgi:hypothetical protein